MMGSVLVQPQRVRRTAGADPAILLMSEVANLGTRLATDAEQGGRVAAIMREASEQALRAFLDARVAAAQSAAPRIADWFLRVMRALTGITPEFRAGSPAQGIELARTVLERIATNLESGTGARIRPYVVEFLDIAQNEFGLSLPAVENMLWEVVDDIIDRLEAEPLEINRVARENRLDTIRILRRVKRLMRGKFPLPVLDADRITDAIVAQLRRIKVDALAQKINCVSTGVGALSDATRAVEELVPISISAFSSLGAAAAATALNEKYLWYPSWLFGEDVVINAAKSEIRKGSQVIASGSNLTIADIPQFKSETTPRYTFGLVGLDALETMAYVAYVSADAIDLVLHLTSLEEGDIASNAMNSLWFVFCGASKLAEGRPVLSHNVESYVMPPILAFLGGWEGMHTKVNCLNWFAMWITLMGPDVLETFIYRTVSTTARDTLLSSFTLMNYQGDFLPPSGDDNRPLNRKHIDGVVSIPGIFINMGQFAVYPREEYAQPFQTGDHALKFFLFWDMLIGTLWLALSKLAGVVLASALSRSLDPRVLLDSFKMFGVPLLSIPMNWILWLISLYMSVEGDTNDGRYNGPNGVPFDEYPPQGTSPYTLPYAAGTSEYVGQANQGIFSHNFMNIQQTYSYDFSMDEGDIILASRPGTVVDYFDWVADDINPNATEQAQAAAAATASGFLVPGQTTADTWNFIAIRHDVDDAGAALAPNNAHDKGAGGAVVTTYAIYGHGRNGSVRELFNARGVASNAIIGTRVRRGQRIMRAGDTGISFHNHLHMMIQSGPAAGTPMSRFNLPNGTIPFVFSDVTHLFSRDGVCKNLNFYTSSTPDLG